MFNVRCRVSGGVTGTREALYKEGGNVAVFPTLEEAKERAGSLTRMMNHPNSRATFEYWAVPASEATILRMPNA